MRGPATDALAGTQQRAAEESLATIVPDRDPTTAVLVLWLSRLTRVNDAFLARLAAEVGLGPSDTSVLVALWWVGPPHELSPTTLRRTLVQTSGGMTATLKRLEAADLVERVAAIHDGRSTLARLTPAGRRIGLRALDHMVAAMEDLLTGVPTDERRALAGSVRHLLDLLETSEGMTDSGPLPPAPDAELRPGPAGRT